MSALTLTGEIVSIGDMPAEEVPQIADVPHIVIELADGRRVLVSGLTRSECAALGAAFLRTVRASFEVEA